MTRTIKLDNESEKKTPEKTSCIIHKDCTEWVFSKIMNGYVCPRCIEAGFFIDDIVNEYQDNIKNNTILTEESA